MGKDLVPVEASSKSKCAISNKMQGQKGYA